ncbi:homoserine dehydrogenase [Rhodoferax saidenbachensis]|uniref:Homoserine dehydrogenase n=1 Tax=Rhodoferax saidenbachensis TaxID=1484693 RepID=A0ABU1ZRV9_9BURK|nr:homoserine dehydrogenase [Rhodoferax saidenbachensis]
MYQDHLASFAVSSHTHAAPPHAIAPLRIGMLGLGTVGAGTYTVLQRNAEVIAARSGRRMELVMVAVRKLARAASIVGSTVALTDDPYAVVNHPDIDVVVEVMGGTTLARELVLRAIANGKHVVTANKALLAVHGSEIFAAAQAQGVVVAYEGAVAVSIPIIKALREGLSANRIAWVAGIINGTTNYILSEMKTKGASFADALADAQAKGYAEADPTFDVEGVDAAHKLTLLAANAFGVPPQFDQVHVEGITQLDAVDIAFAERLGYRVKLLGIAKRHLHGLELRVHPTLVAADHLLADVNGSMNAVMVKSDAAGLTMYYGAGAGSEQTASAVIADLVDLARVMDVAHQHRVPALAFQHSAIAALPVAPIADVETAWYLRLDVARAARTVPQVMAVLADAGVRVRLLEQFDHADDAELNALVLLTDPVQERVLRAAVAQLEALPHVMGFASTLRMERLA